MDSKTKLKLLISLLFLSNILSANQNQDIQSWNNLVLNKDLNKIWFVSNELHLRVGDDVTRLSQFLVRPSISYRLTNNVHTSIGYTWVYTSKPFAQKASHEHNIWQQLQFNKHIQEYNILSRTRLEQRFLQFIDTVEWRLRQLVKISKPVFFKSTWYYVMYDEYFVRFNDSSAKSKSGFEQNRLFFGVGDKLNSRITFEIGYQWQKINRVSNSDFDSHMSLVAISMVI